MRASLLGTQKGMTLIEIMVALALLGILAAFAAPAFQDAFERARLRGAVDDIVSFVNSSRQSAVKLDRDVNLSFQGAATSWCVGARAAADPIPGSAAAAAPACNCSTADSVNCVVDGRPALLSSANLAAPGNVASVDAADIAVIFDHKLGTLQDFSTAGDVVLTSPTGDFQVRIDVAALGQARACIPTGAYQFGGYQPC